MDNVNTTMIIISSLENEFSQLESDTMDTYADMIAAFERTTPEVA